MGNEYHNGGGTGWKGVRDGRKTFYGILLSLIFE